MAKDKETPEVKPTVDTTVEAKATETPEVKTATIAKVPEATTATKQVMVKCVETFRNLHILGTRYSMTEGQTRHVDEEVAYFLKQSKLVM